MSILTLLWKFREYIMAVMIVAMVFGYWYHEQHLIKKDAAIILQLTQEKAALATVVQTQNAAIDQMKKYADQKDAAIASATALSEKMQDTVDAQANEILLRKNNIEQTINTLVDCQSELGRIKAYMVNAEGKFRETK